MNYRNFSLAFGFSVWLVATLIFRIWGGAFFLIDNDFVLAGFFVGTFPLLLALIRWVFARYQLTASQKLESAVYMAIPGMICDVACLKFHELVFPQLTIEQAMVLGAWLLWAYVIVLLIGVMHSLNKDGLEQSIAE